MLHESEQKLAEPGKCRADIRQQQRLFRTDTFADTCSKHFAAPATHRVLLFDARYLLRCLVERGDLPPVILNVTPARCTLDTGK